MVGQMRSQAVGMWMGMGEQEEPKSWTNVCSKSSEIGWTQSGPNSKWSGQFLPTDKSRLYANSPSNDLKSDSKWSRRRKVQVNRAHWMCDHFGRPNAAGKKCKEEGGGVRKKGRTIVDLETWRTANVCDRTYRSNLTGFVSVVKGWETDERRVNLKPENVVDAEIRRKKRASDVNFEHTKLT